jgi:RimJ/RimL family protein N-acetyltransferase
MQHTTIGDRPEVELRWFIHPDYWNRGYAAEMAREAVRVAFDVLEFDDVISFTLHGNAASRAVMEKLGMCLLGDPLQRNADAREIRARSPRIRSSTARPPARA